MCGPSVRARPNRDASRPHPSEARQLLHRVAVEAAEHRDEELHRFIEIRALDDPGLGMQVPLVGTVMLTEGLPVS